MANEYSVNQADLLTVANAIRGKAKLSDPIVFPSGFVDAIANMKSDEELVSILDGSFSGSFTNTDITKLRAYAIYEGKNLTTVNLPNVREVGQAAFMNCTGLTSVYMPKASYIAANAFRKCFALSTIRLGTASDFSNRSIYGNFAFGDCSQLSALIIDGSYAITLSVSNALSGTAIEDGDGYIYVRSSLVDTYKAATNWSKYADQIRAIEDYPDITGG